MNLPTRLTSEPIVDALFEIRFQAKAPVGSILPGFLFASLKADKIENTPTAALPDVFRRTDPNLRAAAIAKVYWDNFYILIGDESLAVGCQLPYPGWSKFFPAIRHIFSLVAELGLIDEVVRYSAKYVDLLPVEAGLNQLQLDLTVGTENLPHNAFMLRTELKQGDYIHGVSVIHPANVQMAQNKESKKGLVLDIDTISILAKKMSFSDFLVNFEDLANNIHLSNKKLFFDFLKTTTIEALGPVYE